MAGKRIKSLVEATAMADGDFTILDNNASADSKKITKANFLKELQAEVNDKQDANNNLLLDTTAKDIVGSINEVNAKFSTIEALDVAVTDAGNFYSSNNAESVLQEVGLNNEASKKYSGFPNRTDSAISIDSGTGVFTIAPTAISYVIYTNGTGKHTISAAQTITITDDQTITYVYFDSTGTLQKSTTAWNLASGDNAPVAIVFKDASVYAITDERHGYERNRAWHKWAHDNIGAMYKSGLTGTFTNTTLSVAQGIVSDEDIQADTGGTETVCTLWYRNATTGMRIIRSSLTPYAKTVGNVLQYDNGTGTLATVDNNKYSTQWVYATHDDTNHIYVVVGQNNDTTVETARNATNPVINLSTAEWKLIYRVIYRNAGGTPTYIEAADFRTVQTGVPSGAITTNHAALVGREVANSHPATAISIADVGNYYTGIEVETALQELGADGVVADYRDLQQDNIQLANLSDTITNNAMVYQTGTGYKNGILLTNPVSFKDSGEILGMKGSTKTQMIGKGNFTGVVVGTDWKNYGTHTSLATGTSAAVFTPVAQYDGIKQDVAGKTIPIISSHKYYVQISSSVASTTKQLAVRLFASDGVTAISTLTNFSVVTTTTKTVMTALVTATASSSTAVFTLQDTSASAFVAITIDDVMMFDLTDELGAGNEPTALAYSSTITSYFDNKISVSSPVLTTVGKNLFDKSTIIAGSHYGADGVLVVNATSEYSTQYIPVIPNTSYKISATIFVNQYDANKNNISRSTVNGFTTTSSTYYIRISQSTAIGTLISIQVELGSLATTYEAYKTNVLSTTETLRSVVDTTTALNQTSYTTTTWAEWTKSAGVVGDATGLEYTSDGVSSRTAYLPTAFSGNKKYLCILNVVSNTLAFTLRENGYLTGSAFNFVSSGQTGNIKVIFTTQATIATNRLYLYTSVSEVAGVKIKIKDVRIVELSAGSQLETDATNLTADQLAANIPWFSGTGTVTLSNRLQDYLYKQLGIWNIIRYVDPATGLKLVSPTTAVATITGTPYIYQGGTSYFSTTTISPTVVENIPYAEEWVTWVPTLTWTSATPGTITSYFRYIHNGEKLLFKFWLKSTDGNAATNLTITLPAPVKVGSGDTAIQCQMKINTTWTQPVVQVIESTNLITFKAAFAATDNVAFELEGSGTYEVA